MSLKISVVTATFNSAHCVYVAISSLLRQTYENFELIIIDGASKDNTVEVIREITKDFAEKVEIISEPDKGIYDALNKGIAKASGDVVAFLHADDFYAADNVLEMVANKFAEAQIDSVYGDLEYVAKENVNKTIRYWKSGEYRYEKLKNGWMPPHPAFFVKKSVYERYGSFDLQFKIAGDYDFMMRVLFKEKISTAYIPVVLVKMRVGGASNKSLKNIIRKSKEDLLAMKRNGLGGLFALFVKNFRKLPQFLIRR